MAEISPKSGQTGLGYRFEEDEGQIALATSPDRTRGVYLDHGGTAVRWSNRPAVLVRRNGHTISIKTSGNQLVRPPKFVRIWSKQGWSNEILTNGRTRVGSIYAGVLALCSL